MPKFGPLSMWGQPDLGYAEYPQFRLCLNTQGELCPKSEHTPCSAMEYITMPGRSVMPCNLASYTWMELLYPFNQNTTLDLISKACIWMEDSDHHQEGVSKSNDTKLANVTFGCLSEDLSAVSWSIMPYLHWNNQLSINGILIISNSNQLIVFIYTNIYIN